VNRLANNAAYLAGNVAFGDVYRLLTYNDFVWPSSAESLEIPRCNGLSFFAADC
jgi:hypothetical protein